MAATAADTSSQSSKKSGVSTTESGPNTSAGAWGLRYPGLVMGEGGKNEVKEFTGTWRYELRFISLFNGGRGYAFPCDARGQVDISELSERLRNNYFHARAVIGREFSVPSVVLVG